MRWQPPLPTVFQLQRDKRMIDCIKGVLVKKAPTRVVVDCNGVGYGVKISLNTLDNIGDTGEEVSLFTHLHVREDIMQVYGFSTEAERDLFLLLISVSKVGPKIAMAILSHISVVNFIKAVQAGDITSLVKIPGVGKQSAERLIVELKRKIDKVATGLVPAGELQALVPAGGRQVEEAVIALESLGYKRLHAEKAVSKVIQEKGEALGLKEIIKTALKHV